jgi:hypothetical protein
MTLESFDGRSDSVDFTGYTGHAGFSPPPIQAPAGDDVSPAILPKKHEHHPAKTADLAVAFHFPQ